MQASTAVKVAALEARRRELVAKLQSVKEKTKEFCTITIKGEDGTEHVYSTEFSHEKYPEIVKATRDGIELLLRAAIDAVEAEIRDL